MLKKLGLVAMLATLLGGCYGPAYGYGYAPRRAYASGRGYRGWHHHGWRRW